MTSEEQFQSPEIQPVNGTEDDHDDEKSTSTSSSTAPVRRSRFFRSKRKQRHGQTDGDDEASHTSDEPTTSSQSPDQEQKTEDQTTISESSPEETNIPVEPTVPKRSLSPPPPPPSSDDTDEPDTGLVKESTEDMDAERQSYLAKKSTQEKLLLAQARPSLPVIYSGYTRKKSQSVKLTRFGPIDENCPKKNVRFADDFGLDLSQIKMIKSDELPTVPSAAFKDLHIEDNDKTNMFEEKMKTITYLEQKFENPIHSHGFEDRVTRHKVVLEQANAIDNRIYGTVKVVSFGINKRVKIRLTTNNWVTHDDHETVYITDSFDGVNDRFTFTVEIPRDRICMGNNIQFCVGYESFVGPEYWDNNYQENYRFECTSRNIPDYSG